MVVPPHVSGGSTLSRGSRVGICCGLVGGGCCACAGASKPMCSSGC